MALDAAAQHPVVLVSGPAGAGKTTVLRQWTSRLVDEVAWFDLSTTSDDHAVWKKAHRALASPPPVTVVLDDLPPVGGDPVPGLLPLLELAGPGRRLVIASRVDPLLSLHPHRLAGRVGELRAADLSFTRSEIEELLRAYGVQLSSEDTDALVAYTEGWAAGVQLTVASIQHEGNTSPLLAAGANGFSASYLMLQVANSLDVSLRTFLSDVAVVGRLDASLARRITGRPDAEALLERLYRYSGFLTRAPENGTVFYRFHRLFQAVLTTELKHANPDRVLNVQRVTAGWHLAQGRYSEAVRYAVQAEDWDVACDAAISLCCLALTSWEWLPVVKAFELLPEAIRLRDPRAQIIAIYLAGLQQDMSGATRIDDIDASQLPEGSSRGRVRALQRLLTSWNQLNHADLVGALDVLSEELPQLPTTPDPSSPDSSVRATWSGSRAVLFTLSGQPTEASRAGTTALAITQGSDPVLAARMAELPIWFALAAGDLDQAANRLDDLVAAGSRTSPPLPESEPLLREWIGMERGTPASPESAREATQPSAVPTQVLDVLRRIVAERRHLLTNEPLEAQQRLASIRTTHPHLCTMWIIASPLLDAEIEAALARNDITHALTTMHRHSKLTMTPAAREAALTWIGNHRALLENRPAAAKRALAATLELNVVQPVEDAHPEWYRVRILLSAAALAHRLGYSRSSSRLLRESLASTERHGWRRPFQLLGPLIQPLLAAERQRISRYSTLLEDLYAHTEQQPVQGLVVSLSAREAEILAVLPTPMNQEELSQHLFITTNTLKSHLRAIYGKLNVSTRREAVLRAQQLGLI